MSIHSHQITAAASTLSGMAALLTLVTAFLLW